MSTPEKATPEKTPKTLFEKVWQQHLVAEPAGEPSILYIDLHLIHEVTSPQAFDGCIPHFCPSRGLLFVDLGTAHPLVVFVAIDWVKDNKTPGQTGAEYTLWLFSNHPLTIDSAANEAGVEHVPPALIHTISRWAAQPTAGTTVVPNITNTVLVDPTGKPQQVPPASLGITPASKQPSATPETQK